VDPTNDAQLIAALCRIKGISWSLVAREALRQGSVQHLLDGEPEESSREAVEAAQLLSGLTEETLEAHLAFVQAELDAARKVDGTFVTVLDAGYPTNLRMIPNLPPFLFVRGTLREDDIFSVAVVGTRQATDLGLEKAARMTRRLVEQGVTVVSGLARGIDAQAHQAALDAGGRTIAVLGTGITNCYPAENRALAESITKSGALVSQFWPTRGGGRDTFPRRNVVTSGISQGTVVIEASSTSGAKMQARLALEHGKKVFLVQSLVTDQLWASKYVSERGAIEVAQVEDVIRQLRPAAAVRAVGSQRQQLSLNLA